jgi:DNA-binding FadR family transcriptional regulator
MPMDELAKTLGTYEVRFVLEAETARLAALRRSSEQMDVIEQALAALRAALLSDAPAHDEDWVLHRAIVEATGNSAFIPVFDHLKDEVMHILRAGVDISRSRPPEVIGAMMDEHDAIVEAIRGRDPDGAALAMRWHLSQGRKRLMP